MRIQLALDPVAACAVGEPLRAAGHDVTEWENPLELAANPGDAVFIGGREAALLCRSVRDAGAHAIVVSPDEDERAAARGAGARAFLALPADADDIAMTLETATRSRPLVLVVDDSTLIHRHTAPILEEAGYDVVSAYDGEEGLRLALGRRPDLVMSDLEMPKRDGYSLCKELKQDRRTASIPVLLCSAMGEAADLEKGFDAGADDYLVKPVVPEELVTRVHALLAAEGLAERERILVVDDSPAVRRLLADTLARQGFQIETAENGRLGLERARTAPPDLLITDYDMPEMSGFELVLALRRDPRTREVPILMLTARERRRDQAQMRAAGLQSYLVKPFGADKCIAVVERLIAEARLVRYKAASRVYLSEGAVRAAEQARDVGDVRADERVMSVMFCDICGFTTLSTTLQPREVVELLNHFFDLLCPILKEEQADIDKFIGDCIMALFEDVPDGDPAPVRAARAALRMQQVMATAKLPIPVQVRIGINTGPLVRGDLGSRFVRRDYTVIGDVVNRAQRLEANAPKGGVLISDTTYAAVKDIAVAEPRVITMKGVAAPVTAYVLQELRS
jgi:CheY-like chemotaxis protein/class 3 adenylate cyclase